jgi:hypothetical protein
MPAGPAPHSSAAQSNITRARSMLCGRYAPSHAGHGNTLGSSFCRTCRAPNISPKILWKRPAVGRAAAAARRADSGSVLLSDVPYAEHFAENPLEAPCCRTRRLRRAKSRLREREATQGRHAVPTVAPRTLAPLALATALPPPPPLTEIDPTPEEARRRPTPPVRSEAEPMTRTAAQPPASAATRSRPPRPPPPPGRRSPALLSICDRPPF